MSERKILRHIVMFGFLSDAGEQQVTQVIERFTALKHRVPGIVEFEWGENTSPEKLNQGHTHCFTLSFDTSEARDVYLNHPIHQEFAQWVGQWVETVTVLDYWATPVHES
ncbi:MAG: Dabb family protein [Granulosicoccus sp.]